MYARKRGNCSRLKKTGTSRSLAIRAKPAAKTTIEKVASTKPPGLCANALLGRRRSITVAKIMDHTLFMSFLPNIIFYAATVFFQIIEQNRVQVKRTRRVLPGF